MSTQVAAEALARPLDGRRNGAGHPVDWEVVGEAMKDAERAVRTRLPADAYVVLRLDGRAFHTYTRHLTRPFDVDFAADMDTTALAVAAAMSGARVGYVQSDEISLVCSPSSARTQAWFDGQVQKIVSVAASLAAAEFNRCRWQRGLTGPLATFDARVFTLPDRDQVAAYLGWRQVDAVRNSVTMAAQATFGHRALDRVPVGAMRRMLTEAGAAWEQQPAAFRLGRLVTRVSTVETVTWEHKRTGEQHTQLAERSRWEVAPAPRLEPHVVAALVPPLPAPRATTTPDR